MPTAVGEPATGDVDRWRPGLVVVLALAGALWLLACWPLLTGSRTLYFRDLFGIFAPLKAFGAQELAQGSVPALNPTWALGQPYRGNPNTGAFYPTNLLYLALPFWIAFNLHLCLHWLLGGVAMGIFARATGRSREAAALAALAYGGGGWMLSALSFTNIVAVAAWWPLVLWGAHRGGRRGLAIGGLCCGLALLAGEPVTAALGTAPLALVAVGRWGWRKGLATAFAIGLAGLAVALPQWIATARVLPSTFRGTHGVLASQAGTYRLEPARLLELIVPLPFGTPERPVAWRPGADLHVPYYYALYPGVVAAVLALAGIRRTRALAILCLAALVVAWSPGVSGQWVAGLSGGLVRSPEKVVFWLALALPMLAAAGFDRLRQHPRRAFQTALAIGALLLVCSVGSAVRAAPPDATTARAALPLAFAASGLLVAAAGWTLWRGFGSVLVGLQLLALVPLQPLLMTDEVAPYEQPSPWAGALANRRAVLHVDTTYPPWQTTVHPPDGEGLRQRARRLASELGPVPGVLQGFDYPGAPDADGMHHRFFDFVLFRMSQAGWDERIAWLRLLGVEALVAHEPVAIPLLRPLARHDFGEGSSATTFLYAIEGSAPAAWWPTTVELAASPADAYRSVTARSEPTAAAAVPLPVEHRPGATVLVLVERPDRIELEVAGEGGLLVVRRSFQTLWRARSGELSLQVLPADLALTGVVVPAGEHRVELFVSAVPEIVASAIALLASVLLLGAALLPRGPRGGR